jgi:hypothetical protein
MYTARVPMSEILKGSTIFDAKKMKKIFAEYGGKECYIHKDNLLVHFDTEDDLIAWHLRWSPDNIYNAFIESFIEEIYEIKKKDPATFGDLDIVIGIIRAEVRK